MDIIKTKISEDIEVQHVFHAKPNSKENYLIYLRFYVLFKMTRVHETTVSTSITCLRTKWSKEGTIKGSDLITKTRNERLRELLDIVRDSLHDLKKMTIKNPGAIKQELENGIKIKLTNKPRKGTKQQYLSKIAQHKLSAVKDSYIATIPNRSETYKKNFRLSVQKFEAWWYHKGCRKEPFVSEITTDDIKLFKSWLLRQKNIKHNTAATYMNRLRTIFNHAVSEKLLSESPIPKKGFIEGYKKGKQEPLTQDELQRLRNVPDSDLTPTLIRVKYIFLFLCSTGMGYGEMKSLRREHVEKDGEDFIITKERNKTGIPFYVPMSETAKHIYRTHFNADSDQGKEPFEELPSIEYITRKVKVLATMAGIKKNVTTYVGRKTFATQWANDGNNIYYLSMILGHRDLQTTMRYVSFHRDQLIKYGREALSHNAFHSMN